MKGEYKANVMEIGSSYRHNVSFPYSSPRSGICETKPVGWLPHLEARHNNIPIDQTTNEMSETSN